MERRVFMADWVVVLLIAWSVPSATPRGNALADQPDARFGAVRPDLREFVPGIVASQFRNTDASRAAKVGVGGNPYPE